MTISLEGYSRSLVLYRGTGTGAGQRVALPSWARSVSVQFVSATGYVARDPSLADGADLTAGHAWTMQANTVYELDLLPSERSVLMVQTTSGAKWEIEVSPLVRGSVESRGSKSDHGEACCASCASGGPCGGGSCG